MQLREWFRSQPTAVKALVVLAVVGVAFVVLAAAVVGTAIVGTFVTSSGEDVSATPPHLQLSASTSGDAVTIGHDGGDAVAADRLVVVVGDDRTAWHELDDSTSAGDSVRAGDSVTVRGVASGDTVRVVWRPPDGGDPVTLLRFRA